MSLCRGQAGGSGCMQVVELGFGGLAGLGWTSDDGLQAASADFYGVLRSTTGQAQAHLSLVRILEVTRLISSSKRENPVLHRLLGRRQVPFIMAMGMHSTRVPAWRATWATRHQLS